MSGPRITAARAAAPPWPSSHEFVEAIQNPQLAFTNPDLQRCQPALDRFGIPLVASGNFAYAFKLREAADQRAVAIRCFRGLIADRDQRYELIDRHLRAHREPALASFVFDADGIMVGGRRFPIVVMEWIEGPTLDLYLQQALSSKTMLQALANQWLRTIQGLRNAQLAHGDLQHGNIIVRDGRFRLIDLDAMYVPAMHGWRSNELGHPHFQHPRRDLNCFDAGIDRFSALVIYLSIIALAEAPELWARYHDENLIFTRQDFADPAASSLFAAVRRLGDTHRLLADALLQALRGRPADTPDLLELVAQKSSLPAWMSQPADLHIEVKTREAPAGSVPAAAPAVAAPVAATTSWPSWHPAGQPPAPPSAQRANPAWVTPFMAYRPPMHFDWQAVHTEALAAMIAYFITTTVLSLPLLFIYGAATSLRDARHYSWLERHPLTIGCLFVMMACAASGYVSAIRAEYRRIQRLSAAFPLVPGTTPPQALGAGSGKSWRLFKGRPRLVGDKLSRIYHRADCAAIAATAAGQRAIFVSAAVAQARGYTPCPSCCP